MFRRTGSARRARLLAAVFGAVLAPTLSADQTTVTTPYQGITYITQTETAPQVENMHIVEVDLTAPGISFMMTPQSGTRDTTNQTTLGFLNQEKAQVAINANFFVPFPSDGGGANVVGLAASQGNVYSGFESQPVAPGFANQSYAIVQDAPALNIDAANNASIVTLNTSYADDKHVNENVSLYNALSGSAQIITDGVVTIPTYTSSGGPLTIMNGYSDSKSWYNHVAARSAVGLSQDGHTLVLFTVDDAGGSAGMTVGQVASIMLNDYGVYNALNLDGGGSTTLAMADPVTGAGGIVNDPADSYPGPGRAVGASLAIFAVPEPATLALLALGVATLLLRRPASDR